MFKSIEELFLAKCWGDCPYVNINLEWTELPETWFKFTEKQRRRIRRSQIYRRKKLQERSSKNKIIYLS